VRRRRQHEGGDDRKNNGNSRFAIREKLGGSYNTKAKLKWVDQNRISDNEKETITREYEKEGPLSLLGGGPRRKLLQRKKSKRNRKKKKEVEENKRH